MPNSNNQQSSGSGLKTAATFGFGALVGALAAGAAYYFSSEEEERERAQRQRQHQHSFYQPNHPANQAPRPTTETEEKDEKDGTVKMCEICFVDFDQLKQCDVQIMSTPCGHVYCRDCIVGALTVKPECPHCRSEVTEAQLRRLYL